MPTSFLDPQVCRTVLASTIQGVAGVGKVRTYRRMLRSDQEVAALMGDGTLLNAINAWQISFALNNTAQSQRKPGFGPIGTSGGGMVLTTFMFQVDGYLTVNDAANSEETFENLAWLICQTINSYGVLDIAGLVEQGPCQLSQCTYAMLANKYFTHYAKLLITMMGRTQ